MPAPGYNNYIFINCPFDEEYMPLLQAIIYCIYRCGFVPQCALGEDDASDTRIDKIIRCIESCKYGIHDISRTQLNANEFPRFNMPFELGIFFGAKRFGNKQQQNKNALVFEKTKYTYQQYISDLNGIDTKAHDNDPQRVIRHIRDWLLTTSKRTTIPGYNIVLNEYNVFRNKLPGIVQKLGLNANDIPFNDFCQIVEEVVRTKVKKIPIP
jgi:hypothetical protein